MENHTYPDGRRPMSRIRKIYFLRLVGRCVILLLCALAFFFWPEVFDVLRPGGFSARLSPLHLLWGIWIIDMIDQLLPARKEISLGSQKLFRQRFRPIREKVNTKALRSYITSTTRAAYGVLLLWVAFGAVIGCLYWRGILDRKALFLLSVVFYVCDLICVLIWCPFRLMMKTRCCTTCRIFNWDHLMMFTPLFFVPGFYARSLCVMSLVVWCVWELCVLFHPERFWENTNDALKCANCTDKLCTQYCQKLRR